MNPGEAGKADQEYRAFLAELGGGPLPPEPGMGGGPRMGACASACCCCRRSVASQLAACLRAGCRARGGCCAGRDGVPPTLHPGRVLQEAAALATTCPTSAACTLATSRPT